MLGTVYYWSTFACGQCHFVHDPSIARDLKQFPRVQVHENNVVQEPVAHERVLSADQKDLYKFDVTNHRNF